LFATVTGADSCAGLNACVGASGPRDFAVRFRAVSSNSTKRPPHPAPYVRDDRETPLRGRETAWDMRLIWVKRETKNFCKRGWTGPSPDSPSGKSPESNDKCQQLSSLRKQGPIRRVACYETRCLTTVPNH
jgi:hypothetical protein